jgi:AcrR family transcriptional regulator
MARQQERARRTRAALVESAAIEFAKRGYAAASVNTILEGSNATKGAMYFHFQSKEELARAVLQAGVEQFTALTERWTRRNDLDPFEALHCLVVDLAELFRTNVIVQAEFRLIIEPEFYADVQSGGSQVWGATARQFALRAQKEGLLREGVDTEKFTRVLAASLAGQRYMADLTELRGDLADLFEESLEVVLAAMASEQWLEKFARQEWPECRSDLPES